MEKTEIISFGSASAKPGEKVIHYEPIMQMADGTYLNMPFSIMNGRYDGPTLVLGGCMHGDEYNGLIALVEAMQEVDLEELHGAIICLPVENPIGFAIRSRLTLLSPCNAVDTLNPSRCWPGNPNGDTINRIVSWLFKEIVKVNPALYLDLHTGALGNECVLHAALPSARVNPEAVAKTRELAIAFGLTLLMEPDPNDVGNYGQDGGTNTEVSRVGIPAYTAELGLGYSMVRDSVKTGVQGIFNTMYYLGMLDGTPVLPSEPPIRLRTEVQYRANSGGITYWDVEPGDRISKGEIIGRTVSVFGDVTEIIRAPEDGYIIQLRRMPTTYTGERIARIGIPYPNE